MGPMANPGRKIDGGQGTHRVEDPVDLDLALALEDHIDLGLHLMMVPRGVGPDVHEMHRRDGAGQVGECPAGRPAGTGNPGNLVQLDKARALHEADAIVPTPSRQAPRHGPRWREAPAEPFAPRPQLPFPERLAPSRPGPPGGPRRARFATPTARGSVRLRTARGARRNAVPSGRSSTATTRTDAVSAAGTLPLFVSLRRASLRRGRGPGETPIPLRGPARGSVRLRMRPEGQCGCDIRREQDLPRGAPTSRRLGVEWVV